MFRVIYMLDALHRQFGVRYNPARIEPSPWDVETKLFPLIAKAYDEPLLHDPGEATFIKLFGHAPGDPIAPPQVGGGDIFDGVAD